MSASLEFLDSFLNYEQAIQYRYPEAFSLDRVAALLTRLNDPHLRYPTLHVAGTKGKGSTCAFTASILSAAGLRTGLYTSPHLFSFHERIQVDGRPISDEELAAGVNLLRPIAGKDLTYFEVTTACAFLHFARANVEAAVIEVGLGGRLDATNVVSPEVTAITPVSLDHIPKLGGTLAAIAKEKAGIIKPDVPVLSAPQEPEAVEVIEQTARLKGAQLHWLGKETQVEGVRISSSGTEAAIQTPIRRYEKVRIPLLGRHQVLNAAMAVRMVELFAERFPGVNLGGGSVQEGIAGTVWPGRCQLVEGSPPLLLDGAQNGASARALRRTVEEIFPGRKVWLIIGASTEKELAGMAEAWKGWPERIFLTQAPVPRAEPAGRLAAAFRACSVPQEETPTVAEALARARGLAAAEDLIVVSGSLFVVAEALKPPVSSFAAEAGKG